jgi:hypothetical protein
MKRIAAIFAFLFLLFSIAAAQSGKGADSVRDKELQAVTVSGALPLITESAGKLVLNVAGSPIAAGGNAYDVLLRIPGVLEQHGDLNFTGRSVNVLIDGRPTHLSGDDLKNMLSNMPANGIDKVEVLSNPSAKYDAQGGAVINIRLAKNRNFGTNGTFTSGIGTGRFVKYNEGASLNYRDKKLNIYGSYDYVHNQQYYDNYSLRSVDADATVSEHEYDVRTRNNHAYKWGLDYDLNSRSSLGILLKGSTNFRGRIVRDSSMVMEKSALDSSSSVLSNGYARFFDPSANIYFKTRLDSAGRKELVVNADYFSYNKRWDDGFITHYFNSGGKESEAPLILQDHSPGENIIKSVTADYTQSTVPGIKWEAGLKTTFTTTDNNVSWQQGGEGHWAIDSGKTNHFIYRENIRAAYLIFSKTFKKIDLQAGLRAEQTSTEGQSITLGQSDKRNYFDLFPNLSLQYNPSAKQQFGLSYRKSIQRFGFDYVNPFIVYESQYAYSQGNPGIEPMIIHTIEFSHSYKYKLFTRIGYSHIISPLGPLYRVDSSNLSVISSYGNLGSADLYNASVTSVKNFFRGKWVAVTTAGAFYARYNAASYGSAQVNARATGFFSMTNTIVLPRKIKAEVTLYYFSPIAAGVYSQGSVFSTNIGFSRAILKGMGNLAFNVTDPLNTLVSKANVLSQGLNIQYNNKTESRYANLVFTYKFGNRRVSASKARKSGIEDEKGRMDAN